MKSMKNELSLNRNSYKTLERTDFSSQYIVNPINI